MFLVKIGTISRSYCLPDTLNSILVLYKIFEKAKKLSKVSDVVTHDEQLHVGCGCVDKHMYSDVHELCMRLNDTLQDVSPCQQHLVYKFW